MCSLTASACVLLPHNSLVDLNSQHFPSVLIVVDSRRRRRTMQQFAALNLVKETGSLLGCSDSFKKGNGYKGLYWGCSGFLRRCKDWDSEGDFSLEAEILEFMKNSKNPKAFPTKKELIDSGRMDLVDAIIKKGGWLALGWNLDEEAEQGLGEVHVKNEGSLTKNEFNVKYGSSEIESKGIGGSAQFFSSAYYSQPAISSGRSVEIAEESGIEGILNRLEKERNSALGLGLRHKEDNVSPENSEIRDGSHHRSSINSVAADFDKSNKPNLVSSTSNPLGGLRSKLDQHTSLTGNNDLRNSLRPETWRSWVIQRNGSAYANFEDAEVAPSGTGQGGVADVSGNDVLEIGQFAATPTSRKEDLSPLDGKGNYNEMRNRIQQLESELSSVLKLLRSGADEVGIQTGQKISSDDLQKLSDAWEFQENEILNAHDTLRTIRAKLAVLEGKMTLAIMDANMIVEEKQKRIDNARQALRFLKTICVVWPNAASEVLLTGSFDGWSTQPALSVRESNKQAIDEIAYLCRSICTGNSILVGVWLAERHNANTRKMEKSNTGVFSVYLQLYPGKYEIKFIVDGQWKIDPLRPIVHDSGYENNLLIVQD